MFVCSVRFGRRLRLTKHGHGNSRRRPASARRAVRRTKYVFILTAPPDYVSSVAEAMQRLRGAAALVRASRAVRQLAMPAVAVTPLAAQSLASVAARQSPSASPLAARAFSTKARPAGTRKRGKKGCGAPWATVLPCSRAPSEAPRRSSILRARLKSGSPRRTTREQARLALAAAARWVVTSLHGRRAREAERASPLSQRSSTARSSPSA